jgi:hypothetical protein
LGVLCQLSKCATELYEEDCQEKSMTKPVDTTDNKKRVQHGEAVFEGGDEHGDVGDEDEQLDGDHKKFHVWKIVCVLPITSEKQ